MHTHLWQDLVTKNKERRKLIRRVAETEAALSSNNMLVTYLADKRISGHQLHCNFKFLKYLSVKETANVTYEQKNAQSIALVEVLSAKASYGLQDMNRLSCSRVYNNGPYLKAATRSKNS